MKISLSNGNSLEVDIPIGHLMWHEEWTHTVSNIGHKDLRAIVVEKQQQTGRSPDSTEPIQVPG